MRHTRHVLRPSAPVDSLPRYVAGRTAAGLDTPGGVVKLSSNELGNGPLPSVKRAMAAALGGIHRYPMPRADDLRTAIAAHLSVDASEIAPGAGSSGVLWQLAAAYLRPGDNVVMHTPTFEAYPIVALLAGAELVRVPLTSWRSDVEALIAAVNDRTRLVLLANPHNPTGTRVTDAEVHHLIEAVSDRCLVIIDEAYVEFTAPGVQTTSSMQWREFPNVVVLRTFSKAHGLAGLRVGYAAAIPGVVEAVAAVTPPFSVNEIGIVAAIASLDAATQVVERVQTVCAERDRVAGWLADRGLEVPMSAANFVFLPADQLPPDFVAGLDAQGVLVRPIGADGVRVSIGNATENDRFLEVTATLLAGRA